MTAVEGSAGERRSHESLDDNAPSRRRPRDRRQRSTKVVKLDVKRPKIHCCRGRKFVDYEITIETNDKAFYKKYSTVRRRYSDFCWLRAKLSSTEINGFGSDERGIPQLPPKCFFSRFNKEVVDSRMQGLKQFLMGIVKFNYFLSFAGLHLFLQTQLPIKEIEGFLEGKYGESVSVEELIQERVLENEEDKAHISCSNENCTVMTSPNWNISSSAEDDIGSIRSSSGSYNSVESLPGPLSSSSESCSFYSVYR
ncbi:sorting nexin-11-like isoform X1 [Acropora palmata]|uniref:sorting nexin-11-like isoform X1 n=1 Tax=Acropora palmata TaxID=6131 RepID=UPI003DA1AD27